jgi:hypothetical protein
VHDFETVFGFFPDGIRQDCGSMVYSETEEIREYIKRQGKKITKTSKDAQKRADANARVNKAEFINSARVRAQALCRHFISLAPNNGAVEPPIPYSLRRNAL